MKICSRLAILTGALALSAAPALALPPQAPSNSGTANAPATTPVGAPSTTPPDNQGTDRKPSTPGPGASPSSKGRAYGRYCQGQGKKHVKGQKGTPFSRCVTDMAKLAGGQTSSPRSACGDESRKHVDGQNGTPFSICVSGGAKLLKDQSSSQS